MSASFQQACLVVILCAMLLAKDKAHSITMLVCSTVGTQAFAINTAPAIVHPSQAEMTLTCYQGGYASDASRKSDCNSDALVKSTHSLRHRDRCVGCGGPHPWMRNGQELCPLKSNPTVCYQDKENYKAWREAHKNRNAKKNHTVNFE
jgi:hypothetical protein